MGFFVGLINIMRLLVFGGKGGVGKSSISTATAVKISQLAPEKKELNKSSFSKLPKYFRPSFILR